ncbi:MAG: Gfo/Idh/MocA family oxidoreductase [Planctomycetota bacterium]|nr:Gfo/Idh/MocA family oxidoreductase [Planctomycetota bacterium]
MSNVRIGVVGCGVIGKIHLDVAKGWPGLEVTAVADVRQEAAKAAAESHGIRHALPDGATLVSHPDVDAVVLALPTSLRLPLALQALKAGKHVLVEKPVAMNAGEVRQIIAAQQGAKTPAGRRPVVACCSSRHRFLASAKVAEAFVATGALGRLRLLRCRGLSSVGGPPTSPPPVWRLRKDLNGGGILMNWGCYDLDYLLGLAGWKVRPRLALAQTWTLAPHLANRAAPGSDAETHAAGFVQCDDGIGLSIERGEFAASAGDTAWQIIGERGSLRLNMLPGSDVTVIHDDTSSGAGVATTTLWQGAEPWDVIHQGPIRDFAGAIAEGRPPKTSIEQALVVQQVTDAIYASARSDAAVAV